MTTKKPILISGGSSRQSNRQALGLFTGAIHIGESEITVGVVDAHHQVLIQAKCAFTTAPGHVNRWHKIPAMLEELTHDARIKISGIGVIFARNLTRRGWNHSDHSFNCKQRSKLTSDLIDRFHVQVATEDDAGAGIPC